MIRRGFSRRIWLRGDNAVCLCPHAERCLEDHELVVQIQASMSSDSKFLFRKNYAKYEFFRNPLVIASSQTFLHNSVSLLTSSS